MSKLGQPRGVRRMIGAVATSLAIAALIATAAPAQAQPRDHHPPPRHFRHHHPPPPPPAPVYGYGVPTVVEEPPPLVYAPPEAPAAIALGLQLNLQ